MDVRLRWFQRGRFGHAIDRTTPPLIRRAIPMSSGTPLRCRCGRSSWPRGSFWLLVVTAFGTSIDAMAVGVSLAFLNVNIAVTAAAIGLTTLVAVTAGVMLGRVLGAVAGRRAEVVGGLLLIGIGSFILFEHLSGRV